MKRYAKIRDRALDLSREDARIVVTVELPVAATDVNRELVRWKEAVARGERVAIELVDGEAADWGMSRQAYRYATCSGSKVYHIVNRAKPGWRSHCGLLNPVGWTPRSWGSGYLHKVVERAPRNRRLCKACAAKEAVLKEMRADFHPGNR